MDDCRRSHRVSGLALAGCRGNAKMDGRREAGEASDPSLDCGDPALIERYDARIFRDMKDKQSLADAITAMDYPGVSRAYRIIDEYGVNVIVPYDTQAFARLRAMADAEGLTPTLIREARPFCVNASLKRKRQI